MHLNCAFCGGSFAPFMRAMDYGQRISDIVFEYSQCGSCGLIALDNVPADLGPYYPDTYYALPNSEAELLSTAERLQKWKLDIVKSVSNGGRLLEIGPAYGLFAFLAKRAGFGVTGIEMDSRCCAFLRDTIGIEVVQSADPLDVLPKLAMFDVVVMWQVIEHMPNARALLDAAIERVAPGGVLIIDTPNPNAFQFKVLGHRWAHLDAPRHVMLIPPAVMTSLATRHGLTTEMLTSAGVSANGFNGFGWAFSFKNFFKPSPLASIAHFVGRVLAKLLIPIERTGGRGSTYTAVYRKPAQ
jgi:SAM-dependent methyltransferase